MALRAPCEVLGLATTGSSLMKASTDPSDDMTHCHCLDERSWSDASELFDEFFHITL